MEALASESGGRPGRDPAIRPLVFVGFMGAGKSSAARAAAAELGAEPLDSDRELEHELGEPIEDFFDREGEAAFREREQAVVLELLERPASPVVSLGGGAVKSDRVRAQLEQYVCVHVDVPAQLAWERARDSGRPLARDQAAFERLHAERLPLYRSLARAVVPARPDGVPGPALDAAIALLDEQVPDTITLTWATTEGGGYPVFSGFGALDASGSLWPIRERCFAVADASVQELHGSRLERALSSGPGIEHTVTFSPGEQQKTLAEAERVLRELASEGMERSDALVALGGGVAGDLAGFCAAVYQRGVSYVQVPTTLVAQVDSAYGGKTGVDLPEAKNYAGAFHQPTAVFTDPGVLETLPQQERRAGFAEVVKTGLIAGGALWDIVRALDPIDHVLERDGDALRAVIEGCLRTKLAVVAADEHDVGERASLNLGHTFAHALEAATGYASYSHGEAVAIGLLVALRLSDRELGLDPSVRAETAELLDRHGLPRAFSGPSTDELLARAALDKKRQAGRANMVLLRAPGDVAIRVDVSADALRAAIEEARE